MSSMLIGGLALAVGAAIMFGINALQGRDAKTQSKRLLEQSKLDGENLIKAAELEKKEKLLQLQSKFDSENQKNKDEIRKREQGIERKEESLKQTAEEIRRNDTAQVGGSNRRCEPKERTVHALASAATSRLAANHGHDR